MSSILVTGAAGFIGAHTCKRFADMGFDVYAVDNFAPYYSIQYKRDRISSLLRSKRINFVEGDLTSEGFTSELIKRTSPETIIHLAAQPGVRLSLFEHDKYVESNLVAFSNVLLASTSLGVEKFLYASSSSVYGNSTNVPFSESDKKINPVSFYGATKLSNELLAQAISTNFGISTRGFRFFTVYGPWGRPDMAYFKLAVAANAGKPFKLFGDGSILRDFTFIDDVVESILKLSMELKPKSGIADVVNVGGNQRNSMLDLISTMEMAIGKKVELIHEKTFLADVKETWADTTLLESLVSFQPRINLEVGISEFISWFNSPKIEVQRSRWAD